MGRPANGASGCVDHSQGLHAIYPVHESRCWHGRVASDYKRHTVTKIRRERILATVSDLVGAFLYYDRKEDEDLPRGEIEQAIAAGEITIADIVTHFAAEFMVSSKLNTIMARDDFEYRLSKIKELLANSSGDKKDIG
jgi:hypothetical protein